METTTSEPTPLTPSSVAAPSPWEVSCLNCGHPLGGPFCSECGQRAVPPHPRVTELAGDAFAEFSGWDGKFSETIQLLVRRPGELTRQFIAGRRVRFISPVRLYLAMSFIYFVLAGAVGNQPTRPGEVNLPGIHISATGEEQGKGPVVVSRAMTAAQSGSLTKAQRDSAMAQVARAPRILKPLLRRGIDDPQGLKRTIVANVPRVFFALLPVFAAILALFYRKRHYPEHLYYAIHLHSFAFLALTLVELATLSGLQKPSGTIGPIVMIWIAVYNVLALRRVYGGSVKRTLAKCVGIGALYSLATGLALLVLVFAAALVG
ncbi:MAG TPA: DUF3667 domain-containing protein [Gemmatimonadaceae bacterium]